jgi:hypothetical protein
MLKTTVPWFFTLLLALSSPSAGEETSRPDLSFRIFNVQSLVTPIKNFQTPPRLRSQAQERERQSVRRFGREEEGSSPFINPVELVNMITASLTGGDEGEEPEDAFVKFANGRLYVRWTRSGIRRVHRILEELEQEAMRTVQLEVLLSPVHPGQENPLADIPAAKPALSDRDVREVLEKARGKKCAVERYTASALNGQRVLVREGAEARYISQYNLEIDAGVSLSDPVLSVVHTGTFLSLRPVLGVDPRRVTLNVAFSTTRHGKGGAKFLRKETPVGCMELPSIYYSSLRTTAAVASGSWLVLRSPARSRASASDEGTPGSSNGGEPELGTPCGFVLLVKVVVKEKGSTKESGEKE